ncbi:MAG TPA: thioredoxin-dependent thiol peroxidase [Cyanothece sp. UBA12306]|nr:thioredoxin-dependent thiol peroxidase [Cyanothece sp. UBA12306]
MGNLPQIGELAPNFIANNQEEKAVKLDNFKSQWLVLYFYPKDNTPGCTTEAKDFTEYTPEFQSLGATILGVSPDTEKSHVKFMDKHSLGIQLLSDRDHKVAEAYGVWGLKKFMGQEYMGIIRSTFLIDPDGKISYIWTKVRVKNHVQTVLNKLKELK